jgi:hypothetical protein
MVCVAPTLLSHAFKTQGTYVSPVAGGRRGRGEIS